MDASDRKSMNCPACSRALTEKQAGSVSLIVCQKGCGGVWFDALELDRMDEESEAVGDLLLHIERDPAIEVSALGERHCPRCQGIPLKRVLLSPGSRVHVHECPSCDACWLDYNEIATLHDERVDLMESGKIEKRSGSSDLIQYLYQVRTGRRR
jgi:Zn-finger nucleic acid-binding protein